MKMISCYFKFLTVTLGSRVDSVVGLHHSKQVSGTDDGAGDACGSADALVARPAYRRVAHGHHALAHVALRPDQDDVEFGREETRHRHCGAHRNGHAHAGDSDGDVVGRAEVDGHERQPDDTRRVHGEADVLGLVERLGNFARQHRVHRADHDQHDGVAAKLMFGLGTFIASAAIF